MDFQDKLYALIDSQKLCEIIYMDEGIKSVMHDRVQDLVQEKDGEFLVLGSGTSIRIDKLIRIDGHISPYLC